MSIYTEEQRIKDLESIRTARNGHIIDTAMGKLLEKQPWQQSKLDLWVTMMKLRCKQRPVELLLMQMKKEGDWGIIQP